jgi:hypothetical protein
MSSIELHIIYGNPETEEWENVTYLVVNEYVPIDFPRGIEHVKQRLESDWNKILLPNNEQIDVMAIKNGENLTLNIRQGRIPLSQIMCNSLSSMCFRTLSGRDVNIQVHSEGAHKNVRDYQNA